MTKLYCDCPSCNPSYEVKLKIYNFSVDMLEYKKLVESYDVEADDFMQTMADLQEKEFDRIFKKNFEDCEKDRALFHSLVNKVLFNFASGKTIDVAAIKKELDHERANNLN